MFSSDVYSSNIRKAKAGGRSTGKSISWGEELGKEIQEGPIAMHFQ